MTRLVHIQIGRLREPVRLTLKLNKNLLINPLFTESILKHMLIMSASTTLLGKLFHILTTLEQNEYFLI